MCVKVDGIGADEGAGKEAESQEVLATRPKIESKPGSVMLGERGADPLLKALDCEVKEKGIAQPGVSING